MGQVLTRNVDDTVLAALRDRAALHGVSLEAELRNVLTRAAGRPREDLAAEFAAVLVTADQRLLDRLVNTEWEAVAVNLRSVATGCTKIDRPQFLPVGNLGTLAQGRLPHRHGRRRPAIHVFP
jgi:plasmid stability protein